MQAGKHLAGRWSLAAAVALAVCLSPVPGFAQSKPVALKGGKLLTITHGTIEKRLSVLAVSPSATTGRCSRRWRCCAPRRRGSG